jgi:hypothetical protein
VSRICRCHSLARTILEARIVAKHLSLRDGIIPQHARYVGLELRLAGLNPGRIVSLGHFTEECPSTTETRSIGTPSKSNSTARVSNPDDAASDHIARDDRNPRGPSSEYTVGSVVSLRMWSINASYLRFKD